jgi:hypothetical protein
LPSLTLQRPVEASRQRLAQHHQLRVHPQTGLSGLAGQLQHHRTHVQVRQRGVGGPTDEVGDDASEQLLVEVRQLRPYRDRHPGDFLGHEA